MIEALNNQLKQNTLDLNLSGFSVYGMTDPEMRDVGIHPDPEGGWASFSETVDPMPPTSAMTWRTRTKDRIIQAAISGDIGGIRAAIADGATKYMLEAALEAAATFGRQLATRYLVDNGAKLCLGYICGERDYISIPRPFLDYPYTRRLFTHSIDVDLDCYNIAAAAGAVEQWDWDEDDYVVDFLPVIVSERYDGRRE